MAAVSGRTGEKCHVSGGIAANELRFELSAVLDSDRDGVGILDHMMVGDNKPLRGVYDDT